MEFELIKEKWEDILLTLKSEHSITDISFNTWLKPLKPHSIEDDTLMIVFQPNYEEEAEPDQMTISYITKKYSKFLAIIISEMFDLQEEMKLKSRQENKPENKKDKSSK